MLSGWNERIDKCAKLVSNKISHPIESVKQAAETFYKKLIVIDQHKNMKTVDGPVLLVRSSGNYMELTEDYGLTKVDYLPLHYMYS